MLLFNKKSLLIFLFASLFIVSFAQDSTLIFTEKMAGNFARMSLNCVAREYPNKPGHVMASDSDALTPVEMHPAFYGCFDWHSAVHGHWLLVKVLKEFPRIYLSEEISSVLQKNISDKNIRKEISFFNTVSNKNFERTYGWAWLLKLAEELYLWNDVQGQQLYAQIKPLADLIASKYYHFLPRLAYPIRIGEHSNTAFGLCFAWDYARSVGNDSLKTRIEQKALEFYFNDKNCPAGWEPGGFDFLSPCLEEADLMQRVLSPDEFNRWVQSFLPTLQDDPSNLFSPAVVLDRTDGKLIHLDGLNLSRAWCFYHLAEKTGDDHLAALGDMHLRKSLPVLSSGNYSGEHWLASFATYALIERRISEKK